jgi:hypothetical protein
MYVNLRKLASGAFGPYEMSAGLERELYHVSITEAGRQFVALREEMAPRV